ncbi:di-heme-cytochrome C peroxidase [Pseudoalteromonas luteoviolacea]|uniref:di-heme-cytochrome C peroxidase n=1 Tax=Pseudoalteromonas luteoviolacea TaxID=43657 RepID=UPI000B11E822|nr:di-heme-cytochrome C peroxidase [Pseudoalteromonas luteoviolacea]
MPRNYPIVLRWLLKKWPWIISAVIVITVTSFAFRAITALSELKYGLTPPTLPKYQHLDTQFLNQNGWLPEGKNYDHKWPYHASQGTATLPIPYEWLAALEAPKSVPWFILFSAEKTFLSEYIYRLGFINLNDANTPYSSKQQLPLGLAKTASINMPGLDRKATAIGFTCTACHTGQFTYDNTRYVVDGGPAMTDLGLLTQSLGAAIGQTVLSSKLAPFDGRFERFARKVLGSNYNVVSKAKLKSALQDTVAQLAKGQDTINVTEGFTRLDALNRIGNKVFADNMDRPENYNPIEAPVNYPHIWTTSWFDWVQYDGSIMQPLIRNAGEALGVEAFVDMQIPTNSLQQAATFSSSIPIETLYQLEKWLAGDYPLQDYQPGELGKITGLKAPKWPQSLPNINHKLVEKGKRLYVDNCQGCHLPTMDTPEFWAKHWSQIEYEQDGQVKQTERKYLRLTMIDVNEIGTDPAQAQVLLDRTVNTKDLGLNTDLCVPVNKNQKTALMQSKLQFVNVQDSATNNFALALGAVVEQTNQQWFAQNYTSQAAQPRLEGGRPNCLRNGAGYKARPLNGIWATAPYLHNGSVPNLYSLLSEPSSRPTFVELGSLAFDPINVGIVQSKQVIKMNNQSNALPANQTDDYQGGFFILDTRQAGNLNTGHAFTNDPTVQGKIGRKLNHDEKMALIEYLKTL